MFIVIGPLFFCVLDEGSLVVSDSEFLLYFLNIRLLAYSFHATICFSKCLVFSGMHTTWFYINLERSSTLALC